MIKRVQWRKESEERGFPGCAEDSKANECKREYGSGLSQDFPVEPRDIAKTNRQQKSKSI